MASVKVAVRVRPFDHRELQLASKCIIEMEGNRTRINQKTNRGKNPSSFKEFTFDYSYWSFDKNDVNFISQQKVFEDLGTDVVDAAFEGYNACVFAYGQTGSGKTYTMMGSPENQGLIPRICESLFSHMLPDSSYRVEVSYLEIYNEKVRDLLSPGLGHKLKIREHPRFGPIVEDLSKHLVSDYTHIQALMTQGNAHRTTANTNMNDYSSRSHAIFTITFIQAGLCNDLPTETVSKIHLVDLAGSERADSTGATGIRLKEGAHINKSLVTLGSVISALAELSSREGTSQRNPFIPYRDSILTWLLKDSLGGNSKTIMIAAISPASCSYNETLGTLHYANRAKNIINKPTINEDPNVKLIRELRAEIKKLKDLMCSDDPSIVVRQTLFEKEAQEKVLTKRWAEKWKETQCILQEQEALALRKAGSGVVLDSERPHLICIDDNLLTTGVTLYHLMDGETLIGTDAAPKKQHIILVGNEMEPEHCSIVLENGKATLIPKPNAHCWVNGCFIDKPTVLFQGCMILVGRTNMFRYNDPVEAEKMRQEGDISRSHLNLSQMSLMTWSSPNLNHSADYNATFETMFDKFTEEKKLGEMRGSERLLMHKSVSVNEMENIGTLACTQDQLEKLKKERNTLEELRSHILEKNIKFAEYIMQKIDSLAQNNNYKISEERFPFELKLNSDTIDKWASRSVSSIELLTRKVGIKCENSLKNAIMDDVRNHQFNMLALIDEEIKMKVAAVSEREMKVKVLESKLNQIVPLNNTVENSQLVGLSDENINRYIAEGQIKMLKARPESPDYLKPSCSYRSSNSTVPLCSEGASKQEFVGSRTLENQSEENFTNGEEYGKRENVLKDLMNKISHLRMSIMQELESGSAHCGIDEQINVLQELQKKCSEMEAWFKNIQNGNKGLSLKEPNTSSPPQIDTVNVQLSPILNSANQCPDSLLPYDSTLSHSIPAVNLESSLDEGFGTLSISIPSFVLRGTGRNAHYVYEIVLHVGVEKWTLLRRYSRFRELHLTMKEKYGSLVSSLEFPPKKILSRRSESLAKERRHLLESYLQSLISVCSQIPSCPLYELHNAPSKQSFVDFSAFFRRGVFETGKYFTS